jgi:hypothetical protein
LLVHVFSSFTLLSLILPTLFAPLSAEVHPRNHHRTENESREIPALSHGAGRTISRQTGKDGTGAVPQELTRLFSSLRASWKQEDAEAVVTCFTRGRSYLYHPAFSAKGGYFSREQVRRIVHEHFLKVTVKQFSYRKYYLENYESGRIAAEIIYVIVPEQGNPEESLMVAFLKKEDDQWRIHKIQLLRSGKGKR